MALILDFPQPNASHCEPEGGVSFADTAGVRLIESISHEHKSNLWYSDGDIRSFKHQSAAIIRTIKSVMPMSQYAQLSAEDTSAFLGLENYLSESGFQGVTKCRQGIRLAVLFEQKRQSGLGIYDPDRLAHISAEHSHLSRRRASVIGLIHAEK